MQIKLGEIAVEVVQKDIKNLHSSVHPPAGKVSIAAPCACTSIPPACLPSPSSPRSKASRRSCASRNAKPPREYLDRESHYVWGKRYLLKLVEKEAAPSVELKHNKMILQSRPTASHEKKQEVLDAWYREQLKEVVPPLIAKWEKVIGVKAGKFFLQKMKTKWGSCSTGRKNIRINTDLAKQCLEYIVAHEITHLLARQHNNHFTALMDAHMPQWREYRETLNSLPLARQEWRY